MTQFACTGELIGELVGIDLGDALQGLREILVNKVGYGASEGSTLSGDVYVYHSKCSGKDARISRKHSNGKQPTEYANTELN